MLNRTNRTLTANLNRLNLGTRSLALVANHGFNGMVTLRLRQAHGDSARGEIVGIRHPRAFSDAPWMWTSMLSCSSPTGPCYAPAYRVTGPEAVPVEVLVPAARPGQEPLVRGDYQAQSRVRGRLSRGARTLTARPATSRRGTAAKPGTDLGSTRVRAASLAAASLAAAGG